MNKYIHHSFTIYLFISRPIVLKVHRKRARTHYTVPEYHLLLLTHCNGHNFLLLFLRNWRLFVFLEDIASRSTLNGSREMSIATE